MDATSTPRVTCAYLDSYVGKTVIVVGKVVQLRGAEAIVDADGNITAHLNLEAHVSVGNGVQLIGRVNPDLSVKVHSSLDLGTNVDFSLANTVVEISHQHKNLFVFDGQSAH